MHILSPSFLDVLDGTVPVPKPAAMPATPPAPEGSERLPAPPAEVRFPIPCINLHPALPGAFDGAEAIPRAFEAFQRGEVARTGAMVHRVIKEVDRGEPLVVREVEIKKGDTLADLEARIHGVEHEIIVEGTKKIVEEIAAEEAAKSKAKAEGKAEDVKAEEKNGEAAVGEATKALDGLAVKE
jgi:phosphoribosylglycinamide formyltransferase